MEEQLTKIVLENPGCPYPGQPTFSGTGDISGKDITGKDLR
jgi:hypothetical protein